MHHHNTTATEHPSSPTKGFPPSRAHGSWNICVCNVIPTRYTAIVRTTGTRLSEQSHQVSCALGSWKICVCRSAHKLLKINAIPTRYTAIICTTAPDYPSSPNKGFPCTWKLEGMYFLGSVCILKRHVVSQHVNTVNVVHNNKLTQLLKKKSK